MKKFNTISQAILYITLVIFCICRIFKLPDIITEINGIIMLISIFTTAFTTIKLLRGNNE